MNMIEELQRIEKIGNKDETKFFKNQICDEWLTTQEAAAYLKISPKTLLNLASSGTIPFYKFGRRNRYLKSELRNLLSTEKRGVLYVD